MMNKSHANMINNSRLAHIRQSRSSGDSWVFLKRQVKLARNSWGPDFSALVRDTTARVAFAKFVDEHLRPEAKADLYTPDRLDTTEFLRRIESWRIFSGKLHPSGFCPCRRFRKLEYIAALEYGLLPGRANTDRLHAHVLLYNLRHIALEDLALAWRELNSIEDLDEPVIERYAPGPEGILYRVKTLGTDVDLIYFSRKLSIEMAAESPF